MPEKILIEHIKPEDVPVKNLGRGRYSREAIKIALTEGQVRLTVSDCRHGISAVHALDAFRRKYSLPIEIMRRGNYVYVISRSGSAEKPTDGR